ncbi:hypothetical protein RHMOL_Rhmol06G0098100 [Rhododendron molle]|uniref:Uncharacterized protein n=1 Tax=Rhododendron molle TaxID=49168 RepID=A0ACC0NCX4_RHOML|nr:hypothetical protein RHMOL_Rhmol06G0098100 [Rhododendron molle]
MTAQRMSLREALDGEQYQSASRCSCFCGWSVSIEIGEGGERLISIMEEGNKSPRFGSQKPKIQKVEIRLRASVRRSLRYKRFTVS